jgi:hypothetical protein
MWVLAAATMLASSLAPTFAQSPAPAAEPLAGLSAKEQREVADYQKARAEHEAALTRYWAEVTAKKAARRTKKAAGEAFTANDYVLSHPPAYGGPQLAPHLLKKLKDATPPAPETPTPVVAEFLQHAKEIYRFTPGSVSEAEFKRRYAKEALAMGLTKEQVVRVYALETGGVGTYDMQSGIDPISKRGKAISTALGYAQLLHANTVNELVKHGETFAQRLEAMARARGVYAGRTRELRAKAGVVRAMLREAKSVPNDWNEHMKLARTPKGLGMHALNMDGDVGPWLQVYKLNGIRELAAQQNLPNLTGAELELMNLAGPGTGLEMMSSEAARAAPTANFFSRGGYERNPVVHNRSSRELLRRLDERMDVHIVKAGAVEFARIFDEVARGVVRGGAR